MGWLSTRWEAEYEGRSIVVARNEFGRGFKIEWDGETIAERMLTWWGLGTLSGTAEHEGKPLQIDINIRWGGLKNLDGICTVKVNGTDVPVRKHH
jgi:hypothetical protein